MLRAWLSCEDQGIVKGSVSNEGVKVVCGVSVHVCVYIYQSFTLMWSNALTYIYPIFSKFKTLHTFHRHNILT